MIESQREIKYIRIKELGLRENEMCLYNTKHLRNIRYILICFCKGIGIGIGMRHINVLFETSGLS